MVYGLVGLKVHSKIALIVRREHDGIRRYVHLGTGNYNPVTARLYTDFSLFTADPDIGADATDLFNYLTGYSRKSDFRRLLVAPLTLRGKLCALIRREIALGPLGRIIFKMNALEDKEMIHLFYDASRAGVRVDLIVRGSLLPAPRYCRESVRTSPCAALWDVFWNIAASITSVTAVMMKFISEVRI